jgi:hypothetical protein
MIYEGHGYPNSGYVLGLVLFATGIKGIIDDQPVLKHLIIVWGIIEKSWCKIVICPVESPTLMKSSSKQKAKSIIQQSHSKCIHNFKVLQLIIEVDSKMINQNFFRLYQYFRSNQYNRLRRLTALIWPLAFFEILGGL